MRESHEETGIPGDGADDRSHRAGGDVIQGVVVVVHRDGRFLMIKRAQGILAGGAWCFVGGEIEDAESQAEAAVREFREEVGGAIRPVGKIWEYTSSDGKLLLHWWLAELDDAPLTANPAEVAEMRWCMPDEIESLPDLLESNRTFTREVGRDLVERDPL